ncbi:MAG: hypothetical protein ICV78_01620 [Tolypothrix sp. Co-bin9]|nr:hypothetical protein [Tolypothrix sp. Co-bin9]
MKTLERSPKYREHPNFAAIPWKGIATRTKPDERRLHNTYSLRSSGFVSVAPGL